MLNFTVFIQHPAKKSCSLFAYLSNYKGLISHFMYINIIFYNINSFHFFICQHLYFLCLFLIYIIFDYLLLFPNLRNQKKFLYILLFLNANSTANSILITNITTFSTLWPPYPNRSCQIKIRPENPVLFYCPLLAQNTVYFISFSITVPVSGLNFISPRTSGV